jgi:predicted small secreted protein
MKVKPMQFPRYSMITKLSIVLVAGIFISACANTMEGVGKDLQKIGTSMDSKSSSAPAPANSPASQTQGKDVVVTPVK